MEKHISNLKIKKDYIEKKTQKSKRLSMCFMQFIYFHLFPSTLNFTLQFETDLTQLAFMCQCISTAMKIKQMKFDFLQNCGDADLTTIVIYFGICHTVLL